MNAKVISILFVSMLLSVAQMSAQDNNLAYHPSMPTVNTEKVEKSDNKVISYKWEFSDMNAQDFSTPEFSQMEEHELGHEVACLRHMVDKSYIYRENPIPGDPISRVLIKKQTVYDALRNVEKYYKKQAKKQFISQDEAAKQYVYILKVAIAAVYEDNTKSFEEALSREKKNPEAQISLFKQVKLVSIY